MSVCEELAALRRRVEQLEAENRSLVAARDMWRRLYLGKTPSTPLEGLLARSLAQVSRREDEQSHQA